VDSPISLLVPCAIFAIASIPLMLNVVPPNRFYGLRTERTLANRELWFRANRFAGCAIFIAAGISAAIFMAQPEYASGRSLVGVAVLLVPLATALVASLTYLRRLSR
jgi:uncharacterized membrane protein